MNLKRSPLVAAWLLLAVACGGRYSVEMRGGDGAPPPTATSPSGPIVVREGDGRAPAAAAAGRSTRRRASPTTTDRAGGRRSSRARGRCATNSRPDEGFTATTLTWGTMLPLTGPVRPVGEQAARVMKIMTETWLNEATHLEAGPLSDLHWGCPGRPGIFGRKVNLEVFSLQANTPEEALGGMRRLIDADNVFLVRDCYLQSGMMGPATEYQNARGVPGIWCHARGMPMPELDHWNLSPGLDPLVQVAIVTGYLVKKLGRERVAILADPADEDVVDVARKVAAHLGTPIPEECVVLKRNAEAPAGMRSEIIRIRTCYGPGRAPDAVLSTSNLLSAFGALEAKLQGWRGIDAGVQWACVVGSCWSENVAQICGDACEGMITDCNTLPCIPWADPDRYPMVRELERLRTRYVPGEPRDIATYAPMGVTVGLAAWHAMVGPDLSREKLRSTIEGLHGWTAGIGPVLTLGPRNHFGGQALWLIRLTGRKPWFEDLTGDFITLEQFGIPPSLATIPR